MFPDVDDEAGTSLPSSRRPYTDPAAARAMRPWRTVARGGFWVTVVGLIFYKPLAAIAACVFCVGAAGAILAKARVRHRTASGLCTVCGYDLRATPGRCPECGAVPAQ